MTKRNDETTWPLRVTVTRINIPPLSTIGYGYGTDENGFEVAFIGDHRPMRDIGEAINAWKQDDDPIIAEVYGHQIIRWSGAVGAWSEGAKPLVEHLNAFSEWTAKRKRAHLSEEHDSPDDDADNASLDAIHTENHPEVDR